MKESQIGIDILPDYLKMLGDIRKIDGDETGPLSRRTYILKFNEKPEGFTVGILDRDNARRIMDGLYTWVLIHPESYVVIADFLTSRELIKPSELLPPRAWFINNNRLVFDDFEDRRSIGLDLDFSFDYYEDDALHNKLEQMQKEVA